MENECFANPSNAGYSIICRVVACASAASFPFPEREIEQASKKGAPGVSKKIGREKESPAVNPKYRTSVDHEQGAIVQFDWLVARQSKRKI